MKTKTNYHLPGRLCPMYHDGIISSLQDSSNPGFCSFWILHTHRHTCYYCLLQYFNFQIEYDTAGEDSHYIKTKYRSCLWFSFSPSTLKKKRNIPIELVLSASKKCKKRGLSFCQLRGILFGAGGRKGRWNENSPLAQHIILNNTFFFKYIVQGTCKNTCWCEM